jgi:cation diffusion facilitator family transporter
MNTRSNDLKLAERGALISIWAYVVLSIIKLIIGNWAHSESLSADGFNNVTDILGNIVVLIGLKLARRPVDDDHAYGHWKFESVASLITSFIMAVVGFNVLKQAVEAIVHNTNTAVDPVGAIVGVGSAVVMMGIYFYNKKLSQQAQSQALLAAAKDNLSDALTSIATSVAIVASSFNLTIIDRLMAIVITIVIFRAAYEIFSDAVFSLSDGFDEEKIPEYTALVAAIPKVDNVRTIRGRTYGANIFLDVVVEMSPDLSVYESHETTEEIERVLREHGAYDIDVHVEPALLPDEERDAYIALDLLSYEERSINGETELNALNFMENGLPLPVGQHLAISDYQPLRLSKKSVVMNYHLYVGDDVYDVEAVWRRHTTWYVVRRMIAKQEKTA